MHSPLIPFSGFVEPQAKACARCVIGGVCGMILAVCGFGRVEV